MAKLSHADSRRLYSWWWDSHISPKNSKWLHENLSDMDIKVKAMIKIIEEDADSFRKRAEMYYRKRPELIKLVEEFYRAYRALAERYDHATGALRQAHQTMAEAFPEQIPLILPDESTAESSSPSGETRAPENEALMSSYPTAFKGDELFFEEFDATMIKEASRLSTTGEIFANGCARKQLNFQNIEAERKDFADSVQKEVHLLSEEPQNLKNQIEHESMRADTAEAEVETMKGTVSELESEKDAISLRYKLSEEKISSLQEDLKKLNDEMLIGMTKLKIVEYRCHQLEKENQSLQLELGLLKATVKKQQKELEKLSISLKGGDRYTPAENLGSQSQEAARVLSMEIQNMERIKVGLEEEIQRLKEEIGSLKEQTCSSALEIKRLQDEIRFLEESNGKLENELGMQVVDKKSLQQEIWYLKSEKKDLEKRHHELMEQIGVVNLNVESLQEMVKELRDGTVELKALCKKHEDERILHLEKLKFIENITEQNAVLEKSLSSANAELEELREKVKTLEECRETLQGKISMHISEKAVLVTQIEAISLNMEKLSDKNELLENSLSDMNVELEGLRGKLNVLEELCQTLRDQNSNLIDEKGTLVTELEGMNRSLENLEKRYSHLEAENLNMEKEKDHILSQVAALQSSLRIEKEEHETLMHSSTSQLATLESQINVLQEKGCAREETLEQEYHKIIYAQIEIFILQMSLHDVKEKNMLLSDKCLRYSETSKCQEKLISDLKKESYIEKKRLTCLSQCIDSLKIYILDTQDENQQLIIEKTVFLTLVEQYGMYLAELQSEKNDLEQESKTRLEELLVLRSEKHQILELNEQLSQNVHACNQNLSDLREAYSTIHSDITQLIEENECFAKKIVDLTEETDTLKVDNSTLEAQRMNLEHLYLIFSSSNAERSLELQILSNKMDQLHLVNTGIEQEIRSLNEKLGDVEIENMNLKQSLVKMEECRSQLENLKDLLVQKEEELLEVNHQVEGLLMDVDDAKAAREELENKNQTLLKYKAQMGKEITDLHQTNGTLTQQVGKLFEEVAEYKRREKYLISQLEDRNKEVECCEVEIATLINDAHIATIGAVTFEEKMLDLLITCESLDICATVQKEMFYEEIAKRNIYEDKLKEKLDSMDGENRGLKNELNEHLPLISSLGNFVASLEQHILFLANHHSLRNQEKQYSSPPFQQKRCIKEGNEDHNATLAFGIFELQKLHAKVNALENVVMDIQSHLEHDIFVSKTALQDGAGGRGELKAKRAIDKEEDDEAAAICKDIILHLQMKEEPGNLMKGKDKPEQTMKDIQLDHVLISSYYENGSSSNAPSGIGSDETNDHMIELWETIDDSKMEKKEPSIDKLEITKKETEANQECNGSISERLSSDAQRLSVLQKTVKELIRNMEIYEPSNNLTSPEFKKVYLRSKEAEETILHLIDTYKKLTKKAQQHDEMGNTNERKISVRARKGSEKIGRLELELLKIEYIWLKLKEEHDYKRARDAERRTRVLLRDYFYGRRDSPRRKVYCCACLRPRTKE